MKKVVIVAAALLLSLQAVTSRAAETGGGQTLNPAAPVAELGKPVPPAAAGTASPEPPMPEKTVRIGYVDMPAIARDSAPGKAAYAEIKARTEKYQKQIQAREKQLQKQKADIEAQLPALTPQQREAKAKEFQKKVESFQKFVQNADKEVRAREEELLAKIFKSVEAAAADYAKAKGYAAVVMKNQMLYIGAEVDSKDLTTEMIKAIDGAVPKK